MLTLEPAHFKFQGRGHAQFVAGAGYAPRPIGGTARDFAHRRQILEGIRQADDDHSVMNNTYR